MSLPSPTQPATLRVLRSVAEVSPADWAVLEDAEALPFCGWRWLRALEESGSVGPGTGWRPHHLTLWRGGQLRAAAPAYVCDGVTGGGAEATWGPLAARLGQPAARLVLASPHSATVGRRALVAPGEDRTGCERALFRGAVELSREAGWTGVHVLQPTEAEAAALEALGFRVRLGVQYHWHNRGYASWDAFLARFSAHRRHQLRRERRALAEQGVRLTTLRGPEALARVRPREVYQLYASTFSRYGQAHPPLTEAFFVRVLAALPDAVEVVVARRGREVLGGAFNVAGPNVLYGRFWGCRVDLPFLHFNVCLYHPVEEAIARPLARFEPGEGGEHKLTRGFEPVLTRSAHLLFHPPLDRLVGDFLRQERVAILQGLPRWRAETGLKH
jgi:predicted N-acyltransferase